jgi:hypothetical protein
MMKSVSLGVKKGWFCEIDSHDHRFDFRAGGVGVGTRVFSRPASDPGVRFSRTDLFRQPRFRSTPLSRRLCYPLQ